MKIIPIKAVPYLFAIWVMGLANTAWPQGTETLLTVLESSIAPFTDFAKRFKKASDLSLRSEGDETVLAGSVEAYGVKDSRFEARFAGTSPKRLEITLNPSDSRNRRLSESDWSRKFASGKGVDLEDWVPSLLPGKARDVMIDRVVLEFESGRPHRASLIVDAATLQPVEGLPLSIEQGTFALHVEDPLGTRAPVAELAGMLGVGSARASLSGRFSSKDKRNAVLLEGNLGDVTLAQLVRAAVGDAAGPVSPPAEILQLGLRALRMQVDTQTGAVAAFADSSLGEVEFRARKSPTVSYQVGMAPPNGFRFAQFARELGFVDELGLTNSAFVVASHEADTELGVFERLGYRQRVRAGLTLLGGYNVRAASAQAADLLGIDSVVFRGNAGASLGSMLLEASIDTPALPLVPNSDVMSLSDASLRVKPDPAGFQMSLGATLDLKAGAQVLSFATDIALDFVGGSMSASGRLAAVDGQASALWSNPFGLAEGIHLRDLGLLLGVNLHSPIPVPVVGLRASLLAGEIANPAFQGIAVLGVDPGNPAKTVIDTGLDRISLGEIVRVLVTPQAWRDMPGEVRDMISSIALEDVRLTIVPSPSGVDLFDTHYDPGFLLQGRSRIADWSGELFVAVDYTAGLEARASMDAIHAEPFFALTGARGAPDPFINVVVKPEKEFAVAMSGRAAALGLEGETDVLVFRDGFDFYLSGKVFGGMFESSVEVAGGDLKKAASLYASAELQSDFNDYFTRQVSAEIDRATADMQRDINAAKRDVSKAQADLDRARADLTALERRLTDERNTSCLNIRNSDQDVARARQDVQLAQRNVNQLQNEPGVQAARRDLEMAQRDLQVAHNQLNNLQNEPGVARAKADLQQAQRSLGDAQARMNNLEYDPGVQQARQQLDIARRDVDTANRAVNEWDRDPNVQAARRDIANKERDVQSLDQQIAAVQRDIDDLNRKLRESQSVSTRSAGEFFGSVGNAVGGGVNYGSQIATKESYKGTLIASRETALFGLRAARDIMNGSIRAAQDAARGTLYAANQTLAVSQQAYDRAIQVARAAAQEGIRLAEGTVYASEQTMNGAVQAAQSMAQQGIRAAEGVVGASQQTYNGVLQAAQTMANEGLNVATGTLSVAENTARLAYDACVAVPIEQALLAPLQLQIDASRGLLEGGKQFLEGVKQTATGTMVAADWIVTNANPLGVLTVEHAGFEGCVGALSGGNVAVWFDGRFAGQPVKGSFQTDFANPVAAVEFLASYLIEHKSAPSAPPAGGCSRPAFAGRAKTQVGNAPLRKLTLVPEAPSDLRGGPPRLAAASNVNGAAE